MDSQDDSANQSTNTTTLGNQPAKDDVTPEDYLNKDILELIGAEGMSKEEQESVYNKMMETVHNRVMARVVDSLTEEQFNILQEILKRNDDKEFAEFAEDTGVDLPKLYAEEALIYKIELVNLIKSTEKKDKED